MNDYTIDVQLAGYQGAAGPVGPSIYDLALKAGFAGTEAEWVASTKGEKGDRGDSIKGDRGDIGLTGASGINVRGYWNQGPTDYTVFDAVAWQGGSFFAIIDPPAGIEPGTPEGEAYWVPLSIMGQRGSSGADSVVPGPPGLSTYEIAVAGGYGGTSAEWLAAQRGPAGPTGISGNLVDFVQVVAVAPIVKAARTLYIVAPAG